MSEPIILGLRLADLLLVGVTTVYVVLTGILAVQAWKQRRDLARAELTVRLIYNDGVNQDVEVVNVGPGHARDVAFDIRFLPEEGAEPIRTSRFSEPAMLAGETRLLWEKEDAYTHLEVRLGWKDAVREVKPEPHTIDVAAFREATKQAGIAHLEEPADEVMRRLRRMMPTLTSLANQHLLQIRGSDESALPDEVWADIEAARIREKWRRRWVLIQTLLGRD